MSPHRLVLLENITRLSRDFLDLVTECGESLGLLGIHILLLASGLFDTLFDGHDGLQIWNWRKGAGWKVALYQFGKLVPFWNGGGRQASQTTAVSEFGNNNGNGAYLC